jgi:hypothetical protein
MPWWAFAWLGAIFLIHVLSVEEDWSHAKRIWETLLDAALGLWCVISVRAHFSAATAARLGRAMLPISVLMSAWLISSVFLDSDLWLLVPALQVLAAVITVVVVIVPLVLGIRRGLEQW